MPGDWDELRVLLAVARAGSLGGAAKALKVDPTTVGRRLGALEELTGARLITRTPEGVQLTAEGQLAVAAAEKMEEALAGLKRQLEGATSEVVRVTSTEAFVQYLFKYVPELAREHPTVRVEYIVDNAPLDVGRGAADIAIRFARPRTDGLVASKCGTIGWSLYGSAAYVARKGPVKLGKLEGHELVALDESLKSVPGAMWLSEHAKEATVVLRCKGPRALADAVAAGLGISVIPCFVAAGNPLLRRVTPEVLATSEVWTVTHEDLKNVPRVRTVTDFIHKVLKRDAALLAGEQ